MNHELAVEILRNEYRAAMAMLRKAIARTPDELWDVRDSYRPVWQIAYHTLFYTGYYIQNDMGADQIPWWDGKVTGMETTPDEPLTRRQIQVYARGIGRTVEKALDALEPGDLEGENGLKWTGPTVGHRLFYNLRHTAHHIGEINVILTQAGAQGPDWRIGSKEKMG